MSAVFEIRDALRDWAQGASGSEREQLRVALAEIVDELEPSIADRIRGMAANGLDESATKPSEQESMKSIPRKKTPKNEQQNQIDWIVNYLREHGPTKVGDLVRDLIASHTALQVRIAPDRSATGRLRTAIGMGIVDVVGGERRSGNGLLRIAVGDVVQLSVQGEVRTAPLGLSPLPQHAGIAVTQSTSASSSSAGSGRDSGEYSRLLNGLPSATSTEQASGRNGVSAER